MEEPATFHPAKESRRTKVQLLQGSTAILEELAGELLRPRPEFSFVIQLIRPTLEIRSYPQLPRGFSSPSSLMHRGRTVKIAHSLISAPIKLPALPNGLLKTISSKHF